MNRLYRKSVPHLFSIVLLAFGGIAAQAADLTVSAAASLSNAFQEIGKEYEKANPGEKVAFNFGASGQLLQQIAQGAPVHVFASADQETMDRAERQNLLVPSSRADFAKNALVVVQPADSNLKLAKLEDLQGPQIQRIAVGIPESVPAGHYAKNAMEAVGVWESLKLKFVYTQNVRQSLDYVMRGEVDVGFVYRTDAAVSANKVRIGFEVPLDKPILYPIAATKGEGNETRALGFIAFVRSESGQRILQKYGFQKP
jgi:molybdate transport system substrate-binding protein